MTKPIKPTVDQQALLFDLQWRMRDACAANDVAALDRLRLELRELFDLNDRGLAAGKRLYEDRILDANTPPRFNDLPPAVQRRLTIESHRRIQNADTSDTRPKSAPHLPAIDDNFAKLPKAQRKEILDQYRAEIERREQASQRPDPDDDNYMRWFETLSNEQRNAELDVLLDRLDSAVAAHKAAQSPVEQPQALPVDENELVDADELATLRQMWGAE